MVGEHLLDLVTGVAILQQHFYIRGINSIATTVRKKQFLMNAIIGILIVVPCGKMGTVLCRLEFLFYYRAAAVNAQNIALNTVHF